MTAAPQVVGCTAMLAGVQLAHHPGYERIVKAESVGDGVAHFDDGWPV